MFLGALERRLGIKKGYSVFSDLRQNLNAGSPTTVDGTFNYEHDSDQARRAGQRRAQPGQLQRRRPRRPGGGDRQRAGRSSRGRTPPTS